MRRLLLIAIFLLTGSSAIAADAANGVHPNIIFIRADDLGPGDLGCYGGNRTKTPNIDRLAKEGTRFDPYYAASPEANNVAADNPEIAARLKTDVLKWRKSMPSPSQTATTK